VSYVVTISDAMNTGVIETITDGVTSGGDVALRGFDAPIVTPPGAGKVLNLYARQDLITCPPRGIVQFSIDGTPVFWGPAVVVPVTDSPGAGPFDRDRDALERITVLGGEQLLKDTVLGPRLFEDEADVSSIAFELCELYAHSALTIDSTYFPLTGATLTVFYAPEKTLYDALTDLAATVPGGASFWVDASGNVHFESIS